MAQTKLYYITLANQQQEMYSGLSQARRKRKGDMLLITVRTARMAYMERRQTLSIKTHCVYSQSGRQYPKHNPLGVIQKHASRQGANEGKWENPIGKTEYTYTEQFVSKAESNVMLIPKTGSGNTQNNKAGKPVMFVLRIYVVCQKSHTCSLLARAFCAQCVQLSALNVPGWGVALVWTKNAVCLNAHYAQ